MALLAMLPWAVPQVKVQLLTSAPALSPGASTAASVLLAPDLASLLSALPHRRNRSLSSMLALWPLASSAMLPELVLAMALLLTELTAQVPASSLQALTKTSMRASWLVLALAPGWVPRAE